MTSSDRVFDLLPVYVQRKIDRAFDAVGTGKPRKAGESSAALGLGGGFIGGGFIREDDGEPEEERPEQISIPMVDIPRALQELDLAPDDEQVLAVFRNAASGWTASSSDEADVTGGACVSREDWRAVCAVLLEHHQEEYQDDSDGAPLLQDFDSDAGDDRYEDERDVDDSSDEYVEGPSTSAVRRRTRGRAAKSTSSSPGPDLSTTTRKLTKRQQEATLEAFALFFPQVPPEDVSKQKIMIKDIQRVAKLLGEKIKADEVRL